MLKEKQREILAGVWAVIAEQGLAAVSVRSVAAASGVSAGRVQHYYGSKAELIRASVAEMLAAAEEAYPEAAGEVDHPDTLWRLVSHTLTPPPEAGRGMSVFYAYVAASVEDTAIGELLADAKRGQVRRVAECLERRNPGAASAPEVAQRLVALADGYTQAVYLGHVSRRSALASLRAEVEAASSPTAGDASASRLG